MNKTVKIRPHRLLILKYLYPYLTLLIFPALRGLISYRNSGVLTMLISGEVTAALTAVSLAVFKYKLCSITLSDDGLLYKKGLIRRTAAFIPAEKIVLVTCESNPFYALFKVTCLKLYTDAGIKGGADINIPIKKKNAAKIMKEYDFSSAELQYRASPVKVLIMAAATSSAATGLLIAAPIIRQAGSLLGEAANTAVIETVLEFSDRIPAAIPRIAGIISVLFIACWGVALLNGILKNARFRLFKKDGVIILRAGLLPARSIVFEQRYLTAVVTRQNWFMRLLAHRSVKMSVGGYGEKRHESSVFLPAVTHREADLVLGEFLPDTPRRKLSFTPPGVAFIRFIMPPIIIFALILPLRMFLMHTFPVFTDTIEFFSAVLAVSDLLFAVCRLILFKNTGFCLNEYLVCSGGGFFNFKTVTAKAADIDHIIITRFFTDRLSRFCRCTFKIRNKNRDKITCASLCYADLQKFLHELYRLEP